MNTETTLHEPAIFIAGHGSRDIEAVSEFERLAESFRRQFPQRRSAFGFLEFARPTIAEGIHNLMRQGATRIIALPGMLLAAGHVKNDIPSELNSLMAANPALKITYAADLGLQPNLLHVAAERIEVAEQQFATPYTRQETLLVVVGRGTSDSDANSNITKITRMLQEGMGFGWAVTCYSGVTYPLVADALERAHGLGFRRVIVFPYFLFTGRLVKKIYAAAAAYQAAHPEVKVVNASYLNNHPLVLAAFMERLREAELGTGNMNCQLCQYRVPILGHENRVGMPQAGHHHHVRGIGTDAAQHAHDHVHHHAHEHEPALSFPQAPWTTDKS